jgi:hypothetical protein
MTIPKHIRLFIFLIFWITILKGQSFNKKYFTETNWFSNNKDSAFYKADTVHFIKYSNKAPEWSSDQFAEDEIKYLTHGDFVKISFEKNNKLFLAGRQNNFQIIRSGKWTWNYDSKSHTICIYCNDIIVSSFMPIAEREIKIESGFAKPEGLLTTNELTLIRIK